MLCYSASRQKLPGRPHRRSSPMPKVNKIAAFTVDRCGEVV
jgi:hypothetical protein